MMESFFEPERIQKLIDFGKASELHSRVMLSPVGAPTNWFCIITIGGTAKNKRWAKSNKRTTKTTINAIKKRIEGIKINETNWIDRLKWGKKKRFTNIETTQMFAIAILNGPFNMQKLCLIYSPTSGWICAFLFSVRVTFHHSRNHFDRGPIGRYIFMRFIEATVERFPLITKTKRNPKWIGWDVKMKYVFNVLKVLFNSIPKLECSAHNFLALVNQIK